MRALVYKSTGNWYYVKDENGKFWNARIKGVLKLDEISSTNPIAVGDEVEIEIENELENSATIFTIYPRKNHIHRQSPSKKYQQHIIASNLDQSILMATLKDPKTSQGFIDRFVVACEMYHVPAIILFNKADLHNSKTKQNFEALKKMYEAVGYKVLLTSLVENTDLSELEVLLKNKTSLLSGHSGVGKSTLINLLCPKLSLKTQEVSGWSGKGLHTTTFSEMYDLKFDGKIIDTPGLREFGLTNISKQELSHYFPEMRIRLMDCQFNNCQHINELDCAIKKAVEKENINIERYLSYCTILDSIEEKKY
ncbi:MAG: ribosome small subunit-dependent GTPase A [Chitinophagaceae bacterium]|nr:MAG: ribosome small subunit-dependent GTPase A [Chitinophagaceae bacterium]